MSAEALPKPAGLEAGTSRRFSLDRLWPRSAPDTLRAIEIFPETPQLALEGAAVETKSIQVFGRKVEAYNITPNADIPPQGRIFLANGWRSQVKNQTEYITHLAQAGYTVTSFDNDFTKGDAADIQAADKALTTGKHPKMAFIKALAIKETMQAFPLEPEERIGIVAHSEGTIYSGIAAAFDPEQFDYFIQINSAAHAKRTSLPGIIVKGSIESRNMRRNGWRSNDPEDKVSASDVVRYVARNSSVALSELRAIACTSTNRLVAHLHDQGLPTGIISGSKDKLFPQRDLKNHIETGTFDYVGEVPEGLHEIGSQPAEYGEKTLEAIRSLQPAKPKPSPPSGGVLLAA